MRQALRLRRRVDYVELTLAAEQRYCRKERLSWLEYFLSNNLKFCRMLL